MLRLPDEGDDGFGARHAAILRTLRRRRGLRAADVAERMGIAKRTYELFESGAGRLNTHRLQQFAEATDTDAFAILMALALRDEAFALHCAEGKLMTAILESVRDFSRETGEHIARLDPRFVMTVLDNACATLGREARRRALPRG